MPSHLDFVLPGIANNPAAASHLIFQVAMAYSTTANRRKLEGHFYALWAEILNLLVYDLKSGVIVCPQYTVYRASHEDPDSSTVTEADRLAVQKIPDFGLIGTILADRKAKGLLKQPSKLPPFLQWADLHIAAWAPHGVTEIKRPAGRHFKFQKDFQADMMTRMRSAVTAAEEQARIVFWESGSEGPAYGVQSLILIAVTGEWWKFRFAHASEFRFSDDGKIFKDMFPSDSAQPGSVVKRPTEPLKNMKPKTEKMKHWTTLDPPTLMEEEQVDVANAMPPPGRWSRFILYGSGASNQRMFLIHEKLQELMAGLQSQAERNVARWKQDGYYSDESEYDEDDEEIMEYEEIMQYYGEM